MWFDEFAKIFALTLWHLSAHQGELLEPVDRSQEILNDHLSVVGRVASDEIVNA